MIEPHDLPANLGDEAMGAVTRERALDVLERVCVRGTRRCICRLPKREERRALVRSRPANPRQRVHSRARVTIPRSLAAHKTLSKIQACVRRGGMKTNVVVPGAGVNYYCPNQDGTRSPTVSSRSRLGRPPRRRRPQARSTPRGPASSSLPTQEPLPPPRHAPRPGARLARCEGRGFKRARGCHHHQLPLRLPPHPPFGSGRPRPSRCRGSRQAHALHGHAGPDNPCRPRPQSGRRPRRAGGRTAITAASFGPHARFATLSPTCSSTLVSMGVRWPPSTRAPPLAGSTTETTTAPRWRPLRWNPPAVVAPRTWLLGAGWRRHGLLRFDEVQSRA